MHIILQDENKKALFEFLGAAVASANVPDGKLLIATHNESVCSTSELPRRHQLAPCSHEEADTRMFIHVKDCTRTGHSKIVVRTGDTDVVVLAVSHYHSFPTRTKLYVEFGMGNAYRSVLHATEKY